MNRLLCLILAMLVLCGCTAPATPTQTSPTIPTVPSTTEPVPPPTLSAEARALQDCFPTIDGSTSLIPLEAGIRAAIFGISPEEAQQHVIHSTTWDSFYNLIMGRVDMIFSCPLSPDQYELAAEEHITLELVPVAMEGFVFVVNSSNPVDSLTQQQLRDIYSGKITNWKEVGGRDEEILPYQRNYDSGSQNFMRAFMGDTPLMDAPLEMRPASMEGLMDVVAINDNASGAIGYSVYAYAANMYGNGNEIKFIEVDGVAPSKKTFADKRYPLLGQNYAVFNADEPEECPVRDLVRWMTSYEGQLAIAKAGYVTADDIGFDYEEMTLSRYEGTGSGPKAQDPEAYRWTTTQQRLLEWGNACSEYLPLTVEDGVCKVTCLTDKKLEAEVNAFIAEQMQWVPGQRDKLAGWVQSQLRGEEYGRYSMDIPWFFGDAIPRDLDHACLVTADNGYLSVAVTVCGANNMGESSGIYQRTETATWDLLTGKRLTPEDLFCKGVDVDAVLNEYIHRWSESPADYWSIYPELKQDFVALPQTGWHLTHDAIYFDMANPYFHAGARISLDKLPDGTLTAGAARSMEGCFTGEDVLCHRIFNSTDRDLYYEYNVDRLVSCGYLKEEVHPNAAAINTQVRDHLNAHFTREAIVSWYAQRGVGEEQLDLWMLDWGLENLGGKYLVFRGTKPYLPEELGDLQYPFDVLMIFELDTGRRVEWEELLLEGWHEHATVNIDGNTTTLPENLSVNGFYQQANGSFDIHFMNGARYGYINVPWEYMNHE